MNALSRWELHPVLNVSGLLFFAGAAIWVLTRLDQEARRMVELRREWGYVISDYELEVQKLKNRMRLFYLGCTLISLIGAMFAALPLLR